MLADVPPNMMPPVTLTRDDTSLGHLLISGTGRAGTTLLVEYFTRLGFDTRFTEGDLARKKHELANAGLETPMDYRPFPLVAKSPFYTTSLRRGVEAGLKVQCLIVPIRDLFSAAESRRRVSGAADSVGLDPESVPGGLTFGAHAKPNMQERRLAMQFFKLVHAAVELRIPIFFLHFPRFVVEPEEVFDSLEPVLSKFGVTRSESLSIMAQLAQPSQVHNFRGDELAE